MKRRTQRKLTGLTADAFWQLIKNWPEGRDLLALGGNNSPHKMIALDFFEVEEQEFLQLPLDSPAQGESSLFSGLGYVACLSYEDFASLSPKKPAVGSRYFKVTAALTFVQDQVVLVGSDENASELDAMATLVQSLLAKAADDPVVSEICWDAVWNQQTYHQQFLHCLEDIRCGRFYQINLLQYFISNQQDINWWPFLRRSGGPFSAWISIEDLQIISFSPERFVCWQEEAGGLRIKAQPIKGTSPVYPSQRRNQESIDFLKNSSKDHAELHMIVDLMRNDLHRVCQPHSVEVTDPGSLHSFRHVHHLIADIGGYLRRDLSLGDILRALCPGGSITGAPKIEVMKAIDSYEPSTRGYFMGNICYFDPVTNYFDSSILIRTVVKLGANPYRFAAGSGLTINSSFSQEWAEIAAKSKVVKTIGVAKE